MRNKIFIGLFMLIALIGSSFATENSLPWFWLRMNNGSRIDLNSNGNLDYQDVVGIQNFNYTSDISQINNGILNNYTYILLLKRGNTSSEIASMIDNSTISRTYNKHFNTSSEIALVKVNNATWSDATAEISCSGITGTTANLCTITGGNTTEEIWGIVNNGTFYLNTNPYNYINFSQTLNGTLALNSTLALLPYVALGTKLGNTTSEIQVVKVNNATWSDNASGVDCAGITGSNVNLCSVIQGNTTSDIWAVANNGTFVYKASLVRTTAPLFINGAGSSGTFDDGFNLSMTQSTGSVGGWISATDWNTFNNKIGSTNTSWIWTTANNGTLALNSTLALLNYIPTNSNIAINEYNITITGGYFMGQPLLGMLGSGIINSTQANALSEVNVTCSGLTCSYNSFEVRLVSGTSDTNAKYCKIPAGSKIATNSAHNVFYIDNSCVVQVTTIDTWFNTLLSQGGQWDFANMVCYNSACEVINGIGLEQRRMMKQRIINFNLNHLKVTSGFGQTANTFPNWTLATGKYLYLMDVVNVPQKVIGQLNSVEIIAPNGTEWTFTDQNTMNFTSCQNGTNVIACSPTNRWRRVFFFMIGWNGTTDTSQVHQLLSTNSITYTSEASCLDTTTTPITYTLPSWYTYIAVPLWAYCVRPTDTVWSASGWIDLRTVKVGSATSSSSTVYVPYSGATGNVDLGSYNLTATYVIANINWSKIQEVPYFVTSQALTNNLSLYPLKTDLTNNITSANTSMKGYVDTTFLKLSGGTLTGNVQIGSSYPASGIILNTDGSARFSNITSVGALIVEGDILQVRGQNISGALMPSLDNQFDIGNATLRWKNIYLSGSIIGAKVGNTTSEIWTVVNNGTFYLNTNPYNYINFSQTLNGTLALNSTLSNYFTKAEIDAQHSAINSTATTKITWATATNGTLALNSTLAILPYIATGTKLGNTTAEIQAVKVNNATWADNASSVDCSRITSATSNLCILTAGSGSFANNTAIIVNTIQLNSTTTRPTCSNSTWGTVWFNQSVSSGYCQRMYVCMWNGTVTDWGQNPPPYGCTQ